MSLEKAITRTKKTRRAEGMVEGRKVSISLRCSGLSLPFPTCKIFVNIPGGEYDSKEFWRWSTANKHFEGFVKKHKLKEVK